MKTTYPVCLLAAFVIVPVTPPAGAESPVPTDAAKVKPLSVGATVPQVEVRTVEGKTADLADAIAEKPSLLIFYRGGWCMFCNRHLAEVGALHARIRDLGVRVVGVSPDRPEKLAETAAKHELEYMLLSDSKMNAARAFGLAFQVDAETVRKYKEEYGIDLEGDSGESHHQLPVPAAFVVDAHGNITFAHADPDYKKRISADALMAALKDVTK